MYYKVEKFMTAKEALDMMLTRNNETILFGKETLKKILDAYNNNFAASYLQADYFVNNVRRALFYLLHGVTDGKTEMYRANEKNLESINEMLKNVGINYQASLRTLGDDTKYLYFDWVKKEG